MLPFTWWPWECEQGEVVESRVAANVDIGTLHREHKWTGFFNAVIWRTVLHTYSRVSQLGCHLNSLKTPDSEGSPSVGCINLLIHSLVALSNHWLCTHRTSSPEAPCLGIYKKNIWKEYLVYRGQTGTKECNQLFQEIFSLVNPASQSFTILVFSFHFLLQRDVCYTLIL